MRNPALFLWSKKIHRYLVLLMVILGIVMMGSGYMMKQNSYLILSPGGIRSVHNTASLFFSIILGVMIITGLYLFLFPYLPVNKEEQPPQANGDA